MNEIDCLALKATAGKIAFSNGREYDPAFELKGSYRWGRTYQATIADSDFLLWVVFGDNGGIAESFGTKDLSGTKHGYFAYHNQIVH